MLLFRGHYGHATSTDALARMVRDGALLPATRTAVAEGESLANPTCHDFVSLDDGDHPLAADALLLRRALLEGADPRVEPHAGRVGRLLAAEPGARRAVAEAALVACTMAPDPARARRFASAAEGLARDIAAGRWVEAAVAHLVAPPPYQIYPRTEAELRARLLHDVLLDHGLEPGAEGIDSPAARAIVASAEGGARERYLRIADRHRRVRPSGARSGVILLFERARLLGCVRPHGDRERRAGPIPIRAVAALAGPPAVLAATGALVPWARRVEAA